ncbi:MAG TPA: VTT domain-containing protein [Terriglobales bacterium]|nr:VTT domain-containing protein [Terriglobales bacterium]
MFFSAVKSSVAQELLGLLIQQQRRRSQTPAVLRFFSHWGGIGLVPLAILDSSPIPTFGSLDVLTAFLSVRHPDLWLYYACMAILGAMVGSYVTYKLGTRTGKVWLERQFGEKRSHQVEYALERWGFGAVFVSTVAPPPCPTALFLLAAGAFGYRLRKFFAAVFAGRTIRYGLLTLVAAHYGRRIMGYVRHPDRYLWISLAVTLLIVAATFAFLKLSSSPFTDEARIGKPNNGDRSSIPGATAVTSSFRQGS